MHFTAFHTSIGNAMGEGVLGGDISHVELPTSRVCYGPLLLHCHGNLKSTLLGLFFCGLVFCLVLISLSLCGGGVGGGAYMHNLHHCICVGLVVLFSVFASFPDICELLIGYLN